MFIAMNIFLAILFVIQNIGNNLDVLWKSYILCTTIWLNLMQPSKMITLEGHYLVKWKNAYATLLSKNRSPSSTCTVITTICKMCVCRRLGGSRKKNHNVVRIFKFNFTYVFQILFGKSYNFLSWSELWD